MVNGDGNMSSQPRYAFLLVRRTEDLSSAAEGLAAYLSFRSPRPLGGDCSAIQGIWIDEDGVANLPSALVMPDPEGARRTVRILETTGINGIWMLCWLEAVPRAISCSDLVAALLAYLGHEEAETAKLAARFIPVFPGDLTDAAAVDELRALEWRYSGLVLPSAYLDRDATLHLPGVRTDPKRAVTGP